MDLTRAWPGTAATVYGAARDVLGLAPTEVIVLAGEGQDVQGVADNDAGPKVMRLAAGPQDDTAVALALRQLILAQAPTGQIRVMSFRPLVRSTVETLRTDYPNLEYLPLAPYSVRRPLGEFAWDENYIPLAEALDHLVGALKAERQGRVRKTELRAALRRQDERFAKVPGTPAGEQTFLGSLLHQASQAGLIRETTVGADASNPWVELTDKGAAAPSEGEPQPRQTAAPCTSDNYISTLRRVELGPFQEVRQSVYAALEQCLAEPPTTQTGHTPSALVRDAVRRVKESSGTRFDKPGKPFPWSRVRIFMITLLNIRPVLLHDGERISHSWSDANRPVDALVDGWRTELDGALVCALLEQGADISWHDVAELSGALYNSRREEHCDLVIEVIQRVIDLGLVDVDGTSAAGKLKLRHPDGNTSTEVEGD